ncbi:hypothetical protein VTL71DRAFT_9473 [Oculimacula yallundae]|uniref:Uncharacterized protein n=1 Tax=Oculimacula yallundae TaxID=86028 RepID=A0ABR4BRZ5_9HELO
MSSQESRANYNEDHNIFEFWQARFKQRRNLDYNEIKTFLDASPASYVKFIVWAQYDNQIVQELVNFSERMESRLSTDALLQEIIWTLETRQLLFAFVLSDPPQSSEDIGLKATKNNLNKFKEQRYKATEHIHNATKSVI